MFGSHEGVWGFNEAHLTGIGCLGLPIEEWLFFITVPYACVFTYACFKKYIPQAPLGLGHRAVTTSMAAICIGLALTYWDRAYLGLTAALCAFWLVGTLIRWRSWMGHFWFVWRSTLPTVMSNGVLTGLDFGRTP